MSFEKIMAVGVTACCVGGAIAGAGVTLPVAVCGMAGSAIGAVAGAVFANYANKNSENHNKLDQFVSFLKAVAISAPIGLLVGTLAGITIFGGSAIGAIAGCALGVGISLAIILTAMKVREIANNLLSPKTA